MCTCVQGVGVWVCAHVYMYKVCGCVCTCVHVQGVWVCVHMLYVHMYKCLYKCMWTYSVLRIYVMCVYVWVCVFMDDTFPTIQRWPSGGLRGSLLQPRGDVSQVLARSTSLGRPLAKWSMSLWISASMQMELSSCR